MPYTLVERLYGKRKSIAAVTGQKPLHSLETTTIKESTMSFVTGRNSMVGTILPDTIADPYAGFLQNARREAQDRLINRGKKPRGARKFRNKNGTQPSTAVPFGPHHDTGHAFWRKRQSMSTTLSGVSNTWRNSGRQVTGGPVFALMPELSFIGSRKSLFEYERGNLTSSPEVPRTTDVNYFTQKAIAECAPNSPAISLAAILGELKEGLPSIPTVLLFKERTATFRGQSAALKGAGKAAGSEWLNLQFGVLPLISDIVAVIETCIKASDTLLQYELDSESGIRRSRTMLYESKSVTLEGADFQYEHYVTGRTPGFSNTGASSLASIEVSNLKSTVRQDLKKRVQFNGSFSYYLPRGKGLASNIERYKALSDRLIGPGLDVETLWQLAPWSWLVDWVFDIGSTISAQSRMSDSNLVMNYGYVSAQTFCTSTVSASFPRDALTSFTSVTSTYRSFLIERVRGNPYGFAIKTPDGFNARQVGILAALGISRS